MRLAAIVILAIVTAAGLFLSTQPRIIGWMYQRGVIFPIDQEAARKWYLKAANEGDADAAYELASMYLSPNILNDEALGLEWLSRAADAGSPRAQIIMGQRYLWAWYHTPVDYAQAYYYIRLAKRNDPDVVDISYSAAQHLSPQDVAALEKRVAEWQQTGMMIPEKIAPQNSGNVMKDVQEAVDKNDFDTARRLLQPLAAQGNRDAETRLGALYAEVDKNYDGALTLFHKAADAGDPAAAAALGEMYDQAKGVKEDKVLAYAWWHLAMKGFEMQGDKVLAQDLAMRADQLRKGMPPPDRSRAEKLARDWTSGKWKETGH